MSRISGNVTGCIEQCKTIKNAYGIETESWEPVLQVTGFLDMLTSGVDTKTLMHRVEDADYVFLCDYFSTEIDGATLSAENSRMLIGGTIYEVKLYDDPMHLHEHMEIYLRYLGGQEYGDTLYR